MRRGSQADVLAQQRQTLQQDLVRIDREVTNLTGAIASGQSRPDAILAAIAERETARKKITAELTNQPRPPGARGQEFNPDAAAKKLRAELKTWREMLEHDPTRGRIALRQLLHRPIEAEYIGRTGKWSMSGVATIAGITRDIFDIHASPATAAEVAGMSPEEVGSLLSKAMKELRAEQRAGGGPLTRKVSELLKGRPRSAEALTYQRLPPIRGRCAPRGDSNDFVVPFNGLVRAA